MLSRRAGYAKSRAFIFRLAPWRIGAPTPSPDAHRFRKSRDGCEVHCRRASDASRASACGLPAPPDIAEAGWNAYRFLKSVEPARRSVRFSGVLFHIKLL